MARTKITVYVTPDVADTLKRLAAIGDRSMSDIIEDAIARRLVESGREAEHAVLIAKIDSMARRLGVIEAAQESHFELTAQSTRFVMSVAPEIPEHDRNTLTARGGERLRNLLSVVVSKLSSGRSTWRETLFAREAEEATAAHLEAAE